MHARHRPHRRRVDRRGGGRVGALDHELDPVGQDRGARAPAARRRRRRSAGRCRPARSPARPCGSRPPGCRRASRSRWRRGSPRAGRRSRARGRWPARARPPTNAECTSTPSPARSSSSCRPLQPATTGALPSSRSAGRSRAPSRRAAPRGAPPQNAPSRGLPSSSSPSISSTWRHGLRVPAKASRPPASAALEFAAPRA